MLSHGPDCGQGQVHAGANALGVVGSIGAVRIGPNFSRGYVEANVFADLKGDEARRVAMS